MKLFEVVTEHEEDNKIRTVRQYVTQKDNDIGKVVKYFVQHCAQYEEELKSVSYIADVVQNIE